MGNDSLYIQNVGSSKLGENRLRIESLKSREPRSRHSSATAENCIPLFHELSLLTCIFNYREFLKKVVYGL